MQKVYVFSANGDNIAVYSTLEKATKALNKWVADFGPDEDVTIEEADVE